MGGTGSSSAQPNVTLAHHRYGRPCPVAFERRLGTAGSGMTGLRTSSMRILRRSADLGQPTDPGPVNQQQRVPVVGEDADPAVSRTGRLRLAAAYALRQHWLAAVLIAAGLVLRVLAELAYRPALFYIDSVKYIYDSQGNDPEGYKAPLRALLLVGNFDTVTAVQHALGLAMAITVYVLLLRRGATRWLA